MRYSRTTASWSARLTLTLASLGCAVLAAACGSLNAGNSSGPGAAPASSGPAMSRPAVPCARIASLRATLNGLSTAAANSAPASRIIGELDRARTQVDALRNQPGAFGSQVRDLSAALEKVTADVRAVDRNASSANLAALASAVGTLRAKAAPVAAEIRTDCPGQ